MSNEKDLKAVFEDDIVLEHHGVQGMKWGVWNAETARKRLGGSGSRRKAKRSVRTDKGLQARIGGKVVETVSKPVKTVVRKRKEAKEAKALAKEQGIKMGQRKAFKELRKQTLRAHDPEAVERGMHTLTDSELTAKITRLEQEKRVRDMANAKKQSSMENARKAEEVQKAKKERKASGLGSQLLKSTYNATVNYAGKKAVDSAFNILGSDSPAASAAKAASSPAAQATAAGKAVVAEVLSVETVYDRKKISSGKA